jgi:hypothetical protein
VSLGRKVKILLYHCNSFANTRYETLQRASIDGDDQSAGQLEKREGESHSSLFSHLPLPRCGGGTVLNYRATPTYRTILQESNSKLAILGDKRNKIEYRIVIEMTSKYVAEVNLLGKQIHLHEILCTYNILVQQGQVIVQVSYTLRQPSLQKYQRRCAS